MHTQGSYSAFASQRGGASGKGTSLSVCLSLSLAETRGKRGGRRRRRGEREGRRRREGGAEASWFGAHKCRREGPCRNYWGRVRTPIVLNCICTHTLTHIDIDIYVYIKVFVEKSENIKKFAGKPPPPPPFILYIYLYSPSFATFIQGIHKNHLWTISMYIHDAAHLLTLLTLLTLLINLCYSRYSRYCRTPTYAFYNIYIYIYTYI